MRAERSLVSAKDTLRQVRNPRKVYRLLWRKPVSLQVEQLLRRKMSRSRWINFLFAQEKTGDGRVGICCNLYVC